MNFLQTISERSSWAQFGVIILIGLVITLPGLTTMPPLDRDEARFAQATVQMLESGDYIRIRFQEDERNKKPAGLHWLQAASVSAVSSVEARAIWAYRLPSILGIILAMVGIWQLGRSLYDPYTGLLAACLFGAAPIVMGEATIAKTDAILTGIIVMAQLALVRSLLPVITPSGRQERSSFIARKIWPLTFWVMTGASILIKGPVGPFILLLTSISFIVLYSRQAQAKPGMIKLVKALCPITGIGLLLVMTVPWALAINAATEGRFFAEAIGGDFLGKIGSSQESHSGPPGYHLLLLPLLFWPASLFMGIGATMIWGRRGQTSILFLLCWLLPAWLIFELTATKLPHYVLPLYPALALLCAHVITRLVGEYTLNTYEQWLLRGGAIIFAAIGVGIAIALPVLTLLFHTSGPDLFVFVSAVAVFSGCGYCLICTLRNKLYHACLTAMAVSFFGAAALLQVILPSLDQLGISTALNRVLVQNNHHLVHSMKNADLTHQAPPDMVVMLGYYEPSAVFLLGTSLYLATDLDDALSTLTINQTQKRPDERQEARLEENPQASSPSQSSIAIIPTDQQTQFTQELSARLPEGVALDVFPLATVEGINYSKGDPISLTINRLSPRTEPSRP